MFDGLRSTHRIPERAVQTAFLLAGIALVAAALIAWWKIEDAQRARWDHRKNTALVRANHVCGEQGAQRIELHVHYEYVSVTCMDGTARTVPL